MSKRPPLELDMTPDGEFRDRPGTPLEVKIGGTAVLVAAGAGALALAGLALWFAMLLLPVAIGAGLIAWLAFRFRAWRLKSDLHTRGAVRRRA